MPLPAETLAAIRGAAEVNAAALASISAEIPAWMAQVEAWNPMLSKGLLRDQLARVLAAYERARDQALLLDHLAQQAQDMIGSGGDPSTLPPSVPWSTGELQIAFGTSGRPQAAQELGRYLVVETVTWDETLSRAEAEVAATAQSDVTFSVDGTPIAVFRWVPGALEAAVTILQAQSVPGDVIVATAPAVRDATLAKLAGTLVGRRRA